MLQITYDRYKISTDADVVFDRIVIVNDDNRKYAYCYSKEYYLLYDDVREIKASKNDDIKRIHLL
jgi:hypothetical protein